MVAHSVSKRSLKPTKITPSSHQQALMVQIKWTSAQVVKYTATKDSTLFTTTMNISKKYGYSAVSHQNIPVKAGMTFYFVASRKAGWYYLLRWSESAQRYNCTCPSHTGCRHQQILADHLEGNYGKREEAQVCEETKAAQPTRELRNVYGHGEYTPQYRENDGDWQCFKDEQGREVHFLGGHEDLAREFIRIDSDECRNAVLAELQRMIDEQWAEYDAEQARKAREAVA